MKQQNILTKIISDAEVKALAIVADAKARADKITAEASEAAEQAYNQKLAQLSARHEEDRHRGEISARLECNKIALRARQDAVSEVFDGALDILCSLQKEEYTAFISRLLRKFANTGDGVVVSSACPYKQEIAALKVVEELNLNVTFDGEFKGGVIITGERCDINLTFEALVSTAKEGKQAEVASRLFG